MTSVTGPSRAIPERAIPGLTPALRARLRWLFRIVSALSTTWAARLAVRLFSTPLARTVEPEEQQFLATAHAQVLRASSGALQLYEWPGTSLAAPTVLVVHGWFSHAARMEYIVRALHARGLRVVAFDAPAHGRSGGRRADLHAFRDAIRAVVAAVGPVQGVLAHSFGAFSTAHWLAEDQPQGMRAAVLVGVMRDLGYITDSFANTMALTPIVRARFRELLRERYGRNPEDVATAAQVQRIHLPMLLVHGAADELVPSAHGELVSEQLRNGRLLIAPDLGHGAPLRDPATAAQIVDFLAAELRA
jgi:pimeloyl-ACP methyl ester carboxylesterase